MSLNNHKGEASVDPLHSNVNIIKGKGEFLGAGVTGLVERLPSGDVVKSPWTGRVTPADCRHDMVTEARIYERLGSHPRLLQFRHWDPVDCVLTLEYMPNGNLQDYVRDHGHGISLAQRQCWVLQAIESIALLHSHKIVQCDVGPRNFLLDIDLNLKICDFGGSSLDGSEATICPGVRYRLPRPGSNGTQAAAVKEDLFALGSTIYFIITGREPYQELTDEDQVEKLYEVGVFPGLEDVPLAEVILSCWRQEAESSEMIYELMKRHSFEQCPAI